MSWPWNPGQRSLDFIGTDTDRSATYDFLLTFHSNHEPISYRYRDKRRHQSVAIFPTPVYFNASSEGVSLVIEYRRKVSKNQNNGDTRSQKCFKIVLADRQTDTRTDAARRQKRRYAVLRAGKKTSQNYTLSFRFKNCTFFIFRIIPWKIDAI